jgi:hypothetical protein
MRQVSTIRSRWLMRASSVAVMWLLFASVGYAAPAPQGVGDRVCDTKTAASKKLLRHRRSFGGPLARPSTRALAGLTDPMVLMKRGSLPDDDDDDAAIQNDAPAAQIDLDGRATPALRPIGLLPRVHDSRLPDRTFTPRSPRGPPLSA